MARTRIDLDGLNELVEKVNRLGSNGNEIKTTALNKAAELVKTSMENKAPKSNLSKVHMADNITISDMKNEDGIDYINVGPQRDDNSKFYYSKFTNFGTSKIPAQHWVEKSLLENKRKINQIIKKELEKELNELE